MVLALNLSVNSNHQFKFFIQQFSFQFLHIISGMCAQIAYPAICIPISSEIFMEWVFQNSNSYCISWRSKCFTLAFITRAYLMPWWSKILSIENFSIWVKAIVMNQYWIKINHLVNLLQFFFHIFKLTTQLMLPPPFESLYKIHDEPVNHCLLVPLEKNCHYFRETIS